MEANFFSWMGPLLGTAGVTALAVRYAFNNKIQSLSQLVESNQKTIDILSVSNKDLTAQVQGHGDVLIRLEELQAKSHGQQEQIAILSTDKDRLLSEKVDMTASSDALQEKVSSLEEDIQKMASDLSSANLTIESLTGAVALRDQTILERDASISRAREREVNAERELSEMNSKISELKYKLSEVEVELVKKEALMEEFSTASKATINRLCDELEKVLADKKMLVDRIGQYQNAAVTIRRAKNSTMTQGRFPTNRAALNKALG